MGEEEKKEWADLVVLDADPVEAMALTYDSERILVKYQKIGGDACTPHGGSAQAVGYDVYWAVNEEIPPEKTVHFPSNIITKPEPSWCLKLYNRSSLAANHLVCILGGPMVIDSDYRGIESKLLNIHFSLFFCKMCRTYLSHEERLNTCVSIC